MVGPGKSLGNYVRGAATEHEAKEAFSRFIDVSRKCQPLIESRVGITESYRLLIHMFFLAEQC